MANASSIRREEESAAAVGWRMVPPSSERWSRFSVPGGRFAIEGTEFSCCVPLSPDGRTSVPADAQLALRRLGASEALDMQLILPDGESARPSRAVAVSRFAREVAYAQADDAARYTLHTVPPEAQIEALFDVLDPIPPEAGGQ